MSTLKIDDIISRFETPVIEHIKGQPDSVDINHVRDKACANASAIQTELGGGAHGYSGLVITPAKYALFSNAPWQNPGNPGSIPTLPNGVFGQDRENIIIRHKEELRLFREFNLVNQALRNQIIAAFDPICLRSIKHRSSGFTNVPIQQIFQHLFDSYGTISEQDLEDNMLKTFEPFDNSDDIEYLFQRMEDCADVAEEGGSQLSNEHVIGTTLNLIKKTGVYQLECREWKAKPALDKTWQNLKDFFTLAQRVLRKENTLTSGRQGYANNAEEKYEEEQHSAASALVNLATATASDRETIASLTSTNANLINQMQEKDTKINDLQKQLAAALGNNNNNNTNYNNNNNNNNYNNRSGKKRFSNTNYCWTHGYDMHDTHTSASCKTKAEGHQDGATVKNNMNGSQRFKDRK